MGLFARFGIYTRGIVYLRSISASLRTLADNDTARMRHDGLMPRVKPRQRVTLETLDLDAAEARWQKQLERNYEDD